MSLFGSMTSEESTSDQPVKTSSVPSVSASKNAPGTVIAKGVRLEGEFKSQGDVQIEGEVVGTVQTDALLAIGPDAVVKADIKAENADIAGKVDGHITVAQRLVVKSTAQLKGDMTCGTLSVESGAMLIGQLSCGAKAAPAATDKPASTTAAKPAISSNNPVSSSPTT